MNYEYLADTVMVLHTILILGVLIGILASARFKRFRPLEAIILLLAIVVWSLYGGCPLTFLENSLRISAGHPLPLSEVGFIPFYFKYFFNLSITSYQLTVATYITALIFLLISIKWISPFINLEIIKIRKSLGLKSAISSK